MISTNFKRCLLVFAILMCVSSCYSVDGRSVGVNSRNEFGIKKDKEEDITNLPVIRYGDVSLDADFFSSLTKSHNAYTIRPIREYIKMLSYLDLPISELDGKMGICRTILKSMCRQLSIQRWPSRQIGAILKYSEHSRDEKIREWGRRYLELKANRDDKKMSNDINNQKKLIDLFNELVGDEENAKKHLLKAKSIARALKNTKSAKVNKKRSSDELCNENSTAHLLSLGSCFTGAPEKITTSRPHECSPSPAKRAKVTQIRNEPLRGPPAPQQPISIMPMLEIVGSKVYWDSYANGLLYTNSIPPSNGGTSGGFLLNPSNIHQHSSTAPVLSPDSVFPISQVNKATESAGFSPISASRTLGSKPQIEIVMPKQPVGGVQLDRKITVAPVMKKAVATADGVKILNNDESAALYDKIEKGESISSLVGEMGQDVFSGSDDALATALESAEELFAALKKEIDNDFLVGQDEPDAPIAAAPLISAETPISAAPPISAETPLSTPPQQHSPSFRGSLEKHLRDSHSRTMSPLLGSLSGIANISEIARGIVGATGAHASSSASNSNHSTATVASLAFNKPLIPKPLIHNGESAFVL